MKKIYTLILIFFSLTAKADYWTQKANFPGQGRSLPFSFSINNKGYTGSGRVTISISTPCLSDFWEYDQLTNVWTQKANFSGSPRIQGVSFSILNKGYVGLGLTHPGGQLNDFWEYNPATNLWTQKSDFPHERNIPIGFSIADKGYVGLGMDSTSWKSDIWEYDPLTDTWTQKQDFAGSPRISAASFAIGNYGYVGMGSYNTGNGLLDFWKYDNTNDTWTQVANFPGTGRVQPAYFTIGNFGYAGTGNQISPLTVLKDFWRYDPVINSWVQKTDFGGTERDETTFFSINNKGYIGLGWQNGISLFNDFWEYTPDSTTGISDFEFRISDFNVYPNPASEFVVISSEFGKNKKIEITITDIQGKKVYQNSIDTRYLILDTKIDISQFSNGIYFVTIDDGKQKVVRKFVKN